MSNIPNHEISGLSTECLDWVSDESAFRYVEELTSDFRRELNQIEEFEEVNDDVLKILNEAEKSVIPSSTQKQNKSHVDKFKNFLSEKKLSTNIESAPPEILSKYLSYFYYSLQTKDGKPYSPASLICIRAAIQRHLSGPEVNRKINILSGSDFTRSNGVLKFMIKKWLENGGKEAGNKYDSIEKNDMEKMRCYFDRSRPDVLQQEAWFSLVYFLALRGREVLHDLPKQAISFSHDSEGKRFLHINKQYITKNVKVSLSSKEYENLSQARMYENPKDRDNCPVTCLEKYLSKIPENCDFLLPMPLKKPSDDGIWYCSKRSLGKNTIGKMMVDISKAANLGKRYTNHCVRVTVVSNLRDNGVQPADIAAVTGHKNINSVEKYVRRKRDAEKENVSTILSNSMTTQHTEFKIQCLEEKVVNVITEAEKTKDSNIIFQNNTNCVFNIYRN